MVVTSLTKSAPRNTTAAVLPHNVAKLLESPTLTDHQRRVYRLLCQIPAGRITTYGALARAAGSSPRAIGGAMRANPFAPDVPCHRCIASTGFIGGYKGDWKAVPSGVNCDMKLDILKHEGVEFDEKGKLIDQSKLWDDFVSVT